MMKRILIATAVGAIATGAAAQAQSDPASKPGKTPRFETFDTLLDASVTAKESPETKASVDDLVIDTRNGQVVFALIDTNGILGSKNKVVAIPYGALTWQPAIGQYTLAATAEQLESLPPCDSGNLARLQDQSWQSTLRGIFDDRHEIAALEQTRGDEYTWYFEENRPESMDGTVVSVGANSMTAQGHECCAIVVEENDSKARHTVFLAPMAYLATQPAVLSAGNDVKLTTVRALDAKGNVIRVANTVRVDGKNIRLRDPKGVPAWDTGSAASQSFYALASGMDDGALYANGEKFGTVSDIVCEVNSGTAAFAIVSQGGVLGIDDTLYAVPCRAITHGRDSNLYVEMPASKLKLAPKLSEDGASDLNEMSVVKGVYEYFELKPTKFDLDRPHRWMKDQSSAGRK